MCAAATPPPQIDPASPAFLNDPLDYFFAEHLRQRQVCDLIDRLADSEAVDLGLLAAVLTYLRHDRLLYLQDEAQELFPLLRQRCPPEDEIEAVLSTLSEAHAGYGRQAARLVKGLEKALAEGQPPQAYRGLCKVMLDFAAGERRHLALVNAVVLPLARLRLKSRDLAALSAGMAARHGTAEGAGE